MKVKVCGITRVKDALLAGQTGAWAVGFIFVKDTPRYVNPKNASEIIKSLPENIEKVGVFADSALDEVVRIAELTGITKIQLHGDEAPDFCAEVTKLTGKEVIKAIRVRDEHSLEQIKLYKGKVSYVLLDSYSEKEQGGTGKTFNWELAKEAKKYDIPLILAGGLNPDNLLSAYEEVKPFALDLSSGVEQEKGIKDPDKLQELKKIINPQCENFGTQS